MTTKAISAVEMVRRIRDAHFEQLRGASAEERIAFYREKARWLLGEAVAEYPTHRPGDAQVA